MPVSDDRIYDWKDDFAGADTNTPVDGSAVSQLLGDEVRNIKSIYREEAEDDNPAFIRTNIDVISSDNTTDEIVIDGAYWDIVPSLNLGTLMRMNATEGGAWTYAHIISAEYDPLEGRSTLGFRVQPTPSPAVAWTVSNGSDRTFGSTEAESGSIIFPAADGDRTADYPDDSLIMFVRNDSSNDELDGGVIVKKVLNSVYFPSPDLTRVYFYGDSASLAEAEEGALNAGDCYFFSRTAIPATIFRLERFVFYESTVFTGRAEGILHGTQSYQDFGNGFITVKFDSIGAAWPQSEMVNTDYAVHITPLYTQGANSVISSIWSIRSKGVDGFTFWVHDEIPTSSTFSWVCVPQYYSEEP